ncbi:IS5 family transposase [Kocuria varians]|uniref:IS5 family transposase n=1 Tax=Kocuria varians TaxID=1272 RepID=UPI000B96EC13|nr:IS5 family transposase [Kocuria varians]
MTDEQWERAEPLLPTNCGRRGRPFSNSRMIVNGIIYRYRTGIPWRDLPRERYGPWQTVWKRHRSYARRGVWDCVLSQVVAQADSAGKVDWTVSIDATINRAHQHATNTTRPDQDTGASSNYKNSPLGEDEPAGHGIGRSRGGLTTKIHQVVDGNGRPLAMVVTGGQRNDGAMMQDTLKDIYVPRPTGRPRTTPDTVMADRGYTSGVNREYLRDHHVKAVIPQKKNEIASRKKKGSKGGRPPAFDAEAYKGRNVVERSFNSVKQWRGLATRYDKLAVTYRSATVLHAILQWLQI